MIALKQQLAEAESLIRRIEDLNREMDALKDERTALNTEINGTAENNHCGLRKQVQKLREEKDVLDGQLQPLKDEKAKLDGQIKENTGALEKLGQQLKEKGEQLREAEEKRMAAENAAKEAEGRQKVAETALGALGSSFDQVESIKRGTVKMRADAFEGLYARVFTTCETIAETDELRALENLKRHVRNENFDFPERLLYAFHTSLKSSDISCLTVMAGVSGTGKSALPKLYSEAIGMHLCMLSVEPRWDSPRDLFGFFNYMENRYEATILARSLIQFDEFATGDLKDQMLLVLLDEMNLARIEYYFSEYLSKLELRRELMEAIKRGDQAARWKVSTELFAGWEPKADAANHNDEQPERPIHLYAGDNVLFAGTMNEDETTQSLSDKVIDRANVLHFGRPAQLRDNHPMVANAGGVRQPTGLLPREIWSSSWCKDVTRDVSQVNLDPYRQRLDELNKVLGDVNRPFAHRTSKAILAYVANYPLNNSQERAFADQIAMRIMPKLRGLDLDMYSTELNAVRQVVNTVNDDALTQAFNNALGNRTHGFFRWQGIDWGA